MYKTRSLILAASVFLATTSSVYAEPKQPETIAPNSNSSIKDALQQYLPKEKIDVRVIKKSIILSGLVSSAEASHKAEKIAREYLGDGKILNFMHIKNTQQVMLRVRIGEISKKHHDHFTNSDFDSYHKSGLMKLVAEPNLVAMSGERAEFLSGGEFPVPVNQGEGAITVDYHSYGIKVGFTPLVLSNNRIRLHVEPEVSELNHNHSIRANGYSIPAISTRRAKTTVELAPGESFMIAGLIEQSNHGHNQKELVISVTPYLVNPISGKDLRLPSNMHLPTKLENKFLQNLSLDLTNNNNHEGPIGFIAD